ncbi:VWA domain-containing protein, partial [Pseudomonas sp.]|uniref:vWA domain-containing protein n=1 Tax=Pseudomonas sp. TaxID=306 RepID=UPI0028AB292B
GRIMQRGAAASARLHWPPTLLAKGAEPLRAPHLRFRRQAAEAGTLHCLVLDCSGSMLKRRNLALAKGLLLRWSEQIYRQRGELMVIGFSAGQARLLCKPQKARPSSHAWIDAIGGGGGSPVAAALELAERTLAKVRRAAPGKRIGFWLLSDGRFDPLPASPPLADFRVVVDFDNAAVPLGRAARLARLWGAECVRAEALLGR